MATNVVALNRANRGFIYNDVHARAKAEQIAEEVDLIADRAPALRGLLTNSQQDLQATRAELINSRAEVQRRAAQVQDLTNEVRQKQAELRTIKETLETTEGQLARAKRDREDFKGLANRAVDVVERQNVQIADLTARNKEMKENMNRMEGEAADLQDQIATQETEIEGLNAAINAQKEDLAEKVAELKAASQTQKILKIEQTKVVDSNHPDLVLREPASSVWWLEASQRHIVDLATEVERYTTLLNEEVNKKELAVSKNSELAEKLNEVTVQLYETKAQHEEALKKVKMLESANENLILNVKDWSAQAKDLSDEKQQQQVQIDELKGYNAAATEKYASLKDELAASERLVAAKEGVVLRKNNEITQLKQDASMDAFKLEKEMRKLESELATLKAEKKNSVPKGQYKKDRDADESRIRALAKQITELKAEARRDADAAAAEKLQLKNTLRDVRGDKALFANNLEVTKAELKALKAKPSLAEPYLKTSQKLTDAKAKLQGALDQLKTANATVAELKEKIVDLEATTKRQAAQLEELREKNQAFVAQIDALQTSAKAEKKKLQDQIQALEARIAKLQTKADKSQGDRALLDSYKDKVDELQEELGSANDANKDLQEELLAVNAAHKAEIEKFDSSILAIQKEKVEEQKDKEIAVAEKERAEIELKKLREQLEDSEKTIQMLKRASQTASATDQALKEIADKLEEIFDAKFDPSALAEEITTYFSEKNMCAIMHMFSAKAVILTKDETAFDHMLCKPNDKSAFEDGHIYMLTTCSAQRSSPVLLDPHTMRFPKLFFSVHKQTSPRTQWYMRWTFWNGREHSRGDSPKDLFFKGINQDIFNGPDAVPPLKQKKLDTQYLIKKADSTSNNRPGSYAPKVFEWHHTGNDGSIANPVLLKKSIKSSAIDEEGVVDMAMQVLHFLNAKSVTSDDNLLNKAGQFLMIQNLTTQAEERVFGTESISHNDLSDLVDESVQFNRLLPSMDFIPVVMKRPDDETRVYYDYQKLDSQFLFRVKSEDTSANWTYQWGICSRLFGTLRHKNGSWQIPPQYGKVDARTDTIIALTPSYPGSTLLDAANVVQDSANPDEPSAFALWCLTPYAKATPEGGASRSSASGAGGWFSRFF